MTPLKKARKARGWTLDDVCARLKAFGVSCENGNLSRIERQLQRPSYDVAEGLAKVFDGYLNEIQIIYPERYVASDTAIQAA
ncbi:MULTISPECIES: helix-turn-helix domain-containing protein [Pseudomonas]|uniref:Helix-turn-helix n=1 Tax=Pseudomonas lutea TaxID=243924 RepID=A0A9X8QM39_9PSED|nr:MULTISPECIES: helix-turn-helix transcriptional regulator [Pseudomonas]SER51388.1 Helix-turn-helix [Pseudomonas lutea]